MEIFKLELNKERKTEIFKLELNKDKKNGNL